MSVRTTLARIVATIANFPAAFTGSNLPGDVLLGETDDAVAIVRASGAPLVLDTTVTAVETVTGALGAAGLARTYTLTITGLREGQRVGLLFTWGAPTGAETLRPSGATVQGDPVTALSGTVGLLSGAASSSGVATCAVTLTASAAASFTVWSTAMCAGGDLTDSQTIAFA